jgi:hypothetical protein
MRLPSSALFARILVVLTNIASAEESMRSMEELQSMSARFAPVDIREDVPALPQNERAALAKLIEASRYVDVLFLRQRAAARGSCRC